jgi:hypothetical protein
MAAPQQAPKQLAPVGQVASSEEHEVLLRCDEEFVSDQNGGA